MTSVEQAAQIPAEPRTSRGLFNLIAAEGVSVAGDWVLNTAASIAVFRETSSTAAVSLLLALAALPTLVLAPLAGAIADRVDRRHVMAWADAASAMVLLLCIGAAILGFQLAAEFAAVFVVAALATFHRPASEALLPSLAGERDLGRVNSTLRLASRLAIIIGPAIASGLMTVGGFRLVLVVDAASFVVSALLIAAIPAVQLAGSATRTSAFRAAAAGLGYARRTPHVRSIVLAIGITMLVAPIVNAGTLTLVSETLHLPESRYGVLLSAEGGGALALALLFMYLGPRLKLLPVGAGALVTTGGATILLGASPGMLVALLAMAIMGMGVVGLQICFASYLQKETEDEMRGRVMSLVSMVASTAGLIGFALAGPAVYAVGVREAFAGAGVVICLSAVPVLRMIAGMGRMAVPAVEAP
ncbi:MAG TPA: MFS transporter [Tepidiformaceae bacterium]|nr:MFS transporter [Tepidiformaceae bacterium]